jgi:TolA-binding protein
MFKKLITALFIALFFTSGAMAQEVEVDRYNINARIDAGASSVDVRAAVTISNLSQAPKSRLYFRLTRLAKISGVTVNNAPAQFDVSEDRRVSTLNQVSVTPAASIGGGASATVEISYRIESPDSTPLAHVYQGETFLAPESVWFPMPSTMFTLYGATTAPFTLTATAAAPAGNFRVASAGTLKGDSSQGFVFEQSLNSLPLIVAGRFDQPVATERGGIKIEVYAQPGITSATTSRPQPPPGSIARLSEEAGKVVDFLTRTLGPPPAGATFRIISSVRAGNISVPGALILNEQALRRETVSATTVEILADAIARIWIDGRVRLRGQEARAGQADRIAQKARSAALLRDSLPRYLAALYVEDRFGRAAAGEVFRRMRWSYAPVAQSGRDAELGLQVMLFPNYTTAVFSKGPLVLRLLAETGGRDKLLSAVKSILAGAQTKSVTIDDFRAALVGATGPEVDKLFQQWIDSIIEPDVIVGAPLASDKPNTQAVNLRNLGTGEVTMTILATTASGKQVTARAVVPSESITSAELPTAEKITSIEVDPEKLILQTNYDNDAREGDMKVTRTGAQTLFNESISAFNRAEYAEAETKLRQALRSSPETALLRAWLARTLAAQKKLDEAAAEANAAIKVEPPAGPALAWAHITLGQVALARNQTAEAAEHLRRALADADEAPAQYAAQELLVKAERAPATGAIDESIRAFITQFDAAVKDPSSDKFSPLVIRNNLKRFVQGLTVSRPTSWTTEILRVDHIDANRVAVDVALKVRAENRDQAGTAVFVLYRASQNWVLEDVQLFNVK